MSFLLLLGSSRVVNTTQTATVSESIATSDFATKTGVTSQTTVSETHHTTDAVAQHHTTNSRPTDVHTLIDTTAHLLTTSTRAVDVITHTDSARRMNPDVLRFLSESIPTNDSYATQNIPYVYTPPPPPPMPYVVPQPLVIAAPQAPPPNPVPGVQIGSVELFLEMGQDFELLPGGDFMLARDSDGMFTATRQRVDRMVSANPILRDSNGKPIGRPTDLQHTDWGTGATGMIGERENIAVPFVQRQTLSSLKGDPGFDSSSVPSVSVTPLTGPQQQGQFALKITAKLASGDTVTFPSIVTGG